MDDLSIVALFIGANRCANVHGVDEKSLKKWMAAMDCENHVFFQKLREYAAGIAHGRDEETAAEILGIPIKVVSIIKTEFPAVKIDHQELKATAKRLLSENMSISEISKQLKISPEEVSRWAKRFRIAPQQRFKTEDTSMIDTITKKPLGEVIKIVTLPNDSQVKDELEDSTGANQLNYEDEFDLIMKSCKN